MDGKGAINVSGMEKVTSGFMINNSLHPTMKPVELMERAIVNSSRSGDIVLDPFSGSGSTLIVCERTGRICRTIELNL